MRTLADIRADIAHTRQALKDASSASSYSKDGVSVTKNLDGLRKLLSGYLAEQAALIRRKSGLGPVTTITTYRRW